MVPHIYAILIELGGGVVKKKGEHEVERVMSWGGVITGTYDQNSLSKCIKFAKNE